MKKILFLLTVLFIFGLLIGCAHNKVKSDEWVLYRLDGKVVSPNTPLPGVIYDLTKVKVKKGEKAFIGVSDLRKSEIEARNVAKKNLARNIAIYNGVFINIEDYSHQKGQNELNDSNPTASKQISSEFTDMITKNIVDYVKSYRTIVAEYRKGSERAFKVWDIGIWPEYQGANHLLEKIKELKSKNKSEEAQKFYKKMEKELKQHIKNLNR